METGDQRRQKEDCIEIKQGKRRVCAMQKRLLGSSDETGSPNAEEYPNTPVPAVAIDSYNWFNILFQWDYFWKSGFDVFSHGVSPFLLQTG